MTKSPNQLSSAPAAALFPANAHHGCMARSKTLLKVCRSGAWLLLSERLEIMDKALDRIRRLVKGTDEIEKKLSERRQRTKESTRQK